MRPGGLHAWRTGLTLDGGAGARALVLVGAWAAGCGTLGGEHGGGEELPNRGIVPYEKHAPDDAGVAMVVPAPDAAALSGPTALAGDGVTLYVAVRAGERVHIARATSPDGLAFGPLETALTGEVSGAPSVARRDDAWHMAVATPAGIGHARSANGLEFTLDSDPLLRPEGVEEAVIGDPSLVATSEGFHLYYTARTAEDDAPPRIALATAGSDLRFTRRGVVFEPGVDCVDFQGEPDPCWDAGGVSAPDVRLATRVTGRPVWRLFYTGRRGTTSGLGFAASDDGLTWSRYAYNPVLEDADERDATQIRLGDRYLLYFLQGRRPAGVAAAVNDRGHPSEDF